MKEKLLIILLMIISVFTITACGNKNKEGNSTQTIKLEDYEYGNTEFTYPKTLSFSVESKLNSKEKTLLHLTSHDYLMEIYLSYGEILKSNYDDRLKEAKSTKAFKEYEWGNYKGFSSGDEKEMEFFIQLEESEIKTVSYIYGKVIPSENAKESIINSFNSIGIQNVLKTIKYYGRG